MDFFRSKPSARKRFPFDQRSESNRWLTSELEARILLAADACVAAETAQVQSACMVNTDSTTSQHVTSSIAFVDPAVDDLGEICESIGSDCELVLLSETESGIEQITRHLQRQRNVESIHIIAHGRPGQVQLGNELVGSDTLGRCRSEIQSWSKSLTVDADIMLYSCDSAAEQVGSQFVHLLAEITGADVAASDDLTGTVCRGGDWELETVVGEIQTPVIVSQSFRNQYRGILGISISAASTTGEEQLLLQVDGQTVATFDNLGGDAYGGVFETYDYNVDGISADQVRLVFTNDLYDPDAGVDRNIRVDQITIDGRSYQAEDPSVFSTGTWLPSDGVQPGFRESEFLHANGYFQFSEPTNSGTLIAIHASGSTGEESMELSIDGNVVQTWSTVGTTDAIYTYQASSTVSADQVRVHFTNDLYEPESGIDRNMNVDKIVVDGQVYESEAPTVYSTGTWLPADGIVPGFRLSETLHSNGYFQYEAGSPPQPGSISLTLDALTIDEDTGTLNFVVFRGDGSDGTVSIDYETIAQTAGAGDFTPASGTLTFDDGITGQQVSVQITDDNIDEPSETFAFQLSNPTGGATIGGIATQLVTITDNDDPFVGILFEDSFEGSTNWTTNPFGTDTATTGAWEAGSPQATSRDGTTLQFDSGHTGSAALVTGLAAGGSVGAYDIDSGLTSALSPEIDLPSGAEVQLSLEYNFAYLNNASNDDFFRVSVVSGGVTTELYNDHAHASTQGAAWQKLQLDLSAFAGQTVQILVEAADEAGGSLVEAAIDDVVVEVLPNLPGTIEVASTGVNIDESAGVATVTLRRTNGRVGTVSVDYATVAGSADTNDYVATSGTATFVDGQAEQSIQIEISDDSVDEDLETFQLVISNATGGAIIGAADTADITIADNDSMTPDYLPDMMPIGETLRENLSIDTSEMPGRTLMRFSTEVANAGDGPLEIWGGSTSGDSQQVFQRIYQADGGSRDRLAGEFVYHAGHGHIHFEGFATYDLKLTDGSGNIVASGGKTSFCLINIRQPLPEATAAAGLVHGRGGSSCGQIQGISVGYSDVYSASLDDQWIDITDVADGTYWLEITADPDNNIQETDETNNVSRVQITLSGGQVFA